MNINIHTVNRAMMVEGGGTSINNIDNYTQYRDLLSAKQINKLQQFLDNGIKPFQLSIKVENNKVYISLFKNQSQTTPIASIDNNGIVVPPGVGYGEAGEGFFRIALSAPSSRIKEAFERMKKEGLVY